MQNEQQKDILLQNTIELFEGDKQSATNWLDSPSEALGHVSPNEFAMDITSFQEVLDLIGRLEHGVFS